MDKSYNNRGSTTFVPSSTRKLIPARPINIKPTAESKPASFAICEMASKKKSLHPKGIFPCLLTDK